MICITEIFLLSLPLTLFLLSLINVSSHLAFNIRCGGRVAVKEKIKDVIGV